MMYRTLAPRFSDRDRWFPVSSGKSLPVADGNPLSGNRFINSGLKQNSNTGEGEELPVLSGGYRGETLIARL
jgi:hypothetical protein